MNAPSASAPPVDAPPAAAPSAPAAELVAVPRAELERLAGICQRAAAGDLEARVTGVAEDAALRPLARSINAMLDIADSFVREASAAMDNCARDRFHRPILLRGLTGAYRQSAGIINAAGIKMRENSEQITFVADLAAKNARNVQTVAAACEELTATSSEISRQTRDTASRREDAVREATKAADSVKALHAAAGKIDRIVTLINKVAGQTNLLALNATIEAARAGEHGRGFAVVATEVKDLSRNTRKATEDISVEVEAMQRTVQEVAELIAVVNASIQSIDAASLAIEKSIGEQLHAINDIGRSIADVSQNTGLVSSRIAATRR